MEEIYESNVDGSSLIPNDEFETIYTFVGSRETPEDILCLGKLLATAFALRGRIGRSGNAKGMDEQLSLGIIDASHMRADGRLLGEIFLPEPDFRMWLFKNVHNASDAVKFISPEDPRYLQAEEIVKPIHGYWDKCNDFARKAHTRNVFQVLGENLDRPSDYTILYAKPKGKKEVNGGTNTAYKLSLERGVKTYNLFYPKQQQKALDFLGITEKQWKALAGEKT